MPDEIKATDELKTPDEKQEGSIWSKAIFGILTALFVGGTTPWWWAAFKENQPSTKLSQIPSIQSSSITSPGTSSSTNLLPLERYEYKEDDKPREFIRVSDKVWKENNEFNEEINTFKEVERNSDFIILYDASRKMIAKIPVDGGQLLITWKEKNWVDLPYRYVAKKNNT